MAFVLRSDKNQYWNSSNQMWDQLENASIYMRPDAGDPLDFPAGKWNWQVLATAYAEREKLRIAAILEKERNRINHKMLIAKDTKKEFQYSKCEGLWTWHDRGEESEPLHFAHKTFLECLDDAVEPYVMEE